jgi:hypothetical protein
MSNSQEVASKLNQLTEMYYHHAERYTFRDFQNAWVLGLVIVIAFLFLGGAVFGLVQRIATGLSDVFKGVDLALDAEVALAIVLVTLLLLMAGAVVLVSRFLKQRRHRILSRPQTLLVEAWVDMSSQVAKTNGNLAEIILHFADCLVHAFSGKKAENLVLALRLTDVLTQDEDFRKWIAQKSELARYHQRIVDIVAMCKQEAVTSIRAAQGAG